ncbi:MAG: Lrp/AsnC family transcriptional regulator [Ilumatobacteraceae bacterium]
MSGSRAGASLDPTDRAIIEQLQSDGRMPYTKLGAAVGLSEAAARQRLQRPESGVDVVVTNPLALGRRRMAMIGVRVEGDTSVVAERLQAIDDIDYLVVTAGSFDLLREVVVAFDEDCSILTNQIRRAVAGVVATESFIYLDLQEQTYSGPTDRRARSSHVRAEQSAHLVHDVGMMAHRGSSEGDQGRRASGRDDP